MPKIQIDHVSPSKPQDIFEKLKTFLSGENEIKKFDPKMQCTFQDSNMTGKAKGGQFNADFAVKPNGTGTKVEVVVDLPLLLTPLKSKVQEIVAKTLAKKLG